MRDKKKNRKSTLYNPNPIDTSSVMLSDDLIKLRELIAKNVHDIWASQRIDEGWSYGEKINSDLKQTPLLVPYEELPEAEKEYDRNTAYETLKIIIKLGYKIIK